MREAALEGALWCSKRQRQALPDGGDRAFHWEVFWKGTSEGGGVILSAAKNLRTARREILRCAQNDRADGRISKKPPSERATGQGQALPVHFRDDSSRFWWGE